MKTIAEGTVRALIDAGADVDAVDGEGDSILDAAVDVFSEMVRGGMDTDEASSQQHVVVDMLLEAGANGAAVGPSGRSSLHRGLVQPGYPPDVLVALVKAGADPNLLYPIEGKTMLPLVMAMLRKQPPEVIAALVSAGADIHAPVAMAGGKPFIEVVRQKWPERVGELEGS